MADFRVGYLYSLSPIHCGGEGDLGNILEIAREAHTNFPYVPGSSLRGSLRDAVSQNYGEEVTDRIFGKELKPGSQMGVHQAWFGDARILWMPMRTMSMQGKDVFVWVSCHSLIRDHGLISKSGVEFTLDIAVGDRPGQYMIADAQIQVQALTDNQKQALSLSGTWPNDFHSVATTWQQSRIILPDSDFQVLMEHSLWTQVRNKIQAETETQAGGSAEIFWTDVCIPRDTIFYFPWGYSLLAKNPVTEEDHLALTTILTSLIQVGGQANVGRGWTQSWIANASAPTQSVNLAAQLVGA